MTLALVILAAGKGTRMNSDLPKVLHPIGQAPMLAHALRAGADLAPARTVVIDTTQHTPAAAAAMIAPLLRTGRATQPR